MKTIAFGPIPSRRLGQSLGVNHIPPKSCSYDCIYCQVGPTSHKTVQRSTFYQPEEVLESVQQKAALTRQSGARIDYLSFVPDGEPTLDINLRREIDLLRPLGVKIAVMSNASLLWREDVRQDLDQADCVSLKVDAVDEAIWRKINRPSADLSLKDILESALQFARAFKGELITETMLVAGINDSRESLQATAEYLHKLDPDVAYLAVPVRPPAERWVEIPAEQTLVEAYQVFAAHLKKVEILTGFSPESYVLVGDPIQDALAIMTVHPMRESEFLELLAKGGLDETTLEVLLKDGKIARAVHEGQAFLVRKW